MDTIAIRGARTHNLKDISLELPRDKLIVITGLSGSGKSTVIRCLNRLIEPTSGVVKIDGEDYVILKEEDVLGVIE